MKFSRRLSSAAIFLSSAFLVCNSHASSKFGTNKGSLSSVLKADSVNADRITNIIDAEGNVELRRDNSVVYSNKVTYDKNSGWIRAIGNVRIKNIEIGNVVAKDAKIKDDFSNGTFSDSVMVMSDGSYLTSPQIDRETPEVTVLHSSIYSLCPNPEISADNSLAGKDRDMLSIKSSKATIDRQQQFFKLNNGVVRLYNFPVFYTPYLKSALPSKGRQTGFLPPAYVSNKYGLGFQVPYYVNIAPNKDLTVTSYLNPGRNLYIVKNDFRHMTSYGNYNIMPEIANNNIVYSNDATTISRSTSPYRWNLKGEGKFDFTQNTGLTFSLNDVYDRNYLRDYHSDYIGYTVSKVNLDYIHKRDYYAVKTIRFQELETASTEKAAPTIMPMIDSHIESKTLSNKTKFALTSNMTTLSRDDGLQYRRATATPEVNMPFNIDGNLFTANAKIQGDFYSLENNFKGTTATNHYNSTAINYKPEASLNWSLPLIKRSKSNAFMIEPMANIVTSSFKRNFNSMPNEDSNNSQLTVNNLFVNDRISGFDRNEAGTRTSAGARTSFFNRFGEYALTLGQSYRISSKNQDVAIQGFNNNNKSNFVGLMSYKAVKYFSASYAFQLNESNYQNDINEVNTNLDFEHFSFTSNYLLLLKTTQNTTKREQIFLGSKFKFNQKASVGLTMNKDLVTGRVLTRGLTFNREGCCTVFGLTVTENNQSNLTKPSKSISFSLSFKNL